MKTAAAMRAAKPIRRIPTYNVRSRRCSLRFRDLLTGIGLPVELATAVPKHIYRAGPSWKYLVLNHLYACLNWSSARFNYKPRTSLVAASPPGKKHVRLRGESH